MATPPEVAQPRIAIEAPQKKNIPLRWAFVLVPGFLIYFAHIPGFNTSQRHLLGIFLATIIALVARPVPMGVSVITSMALLGVTRNLSPQTILSGFGNPTIWLVFTAFLFARAVTQTHFGLRVAYVIISRFGRSPLTLGYSIAASDLVLAPFVPSDTARGGGIIAPIIRGLAQALDSEPGPTASRAGTFLMLVGFHSTYTASGMFLTGMAANPLIAEFARKIANVDLTWGKWAAAASLPGLLSLILVPYLIYRLSPPELKNIAVARDLARQELKVMGPLSRNQRLLVAVLLLTMAGWVTSPWHGIHNTVVALCAVGVLLLSRVISWDDLLSEKNAWDALVWFAPLVMMAEVLNEAGVIRIISAPIVGHMHGLPWLVALLILVTAYVYCHYAFASMTAHVTALYPSFLSAAVVSGIPPQLAAMPLAFFSNLNAGITHYGTGSAPVYFGTGYVDQGTWWKLGFIISVVNLLIWLGIGILWWKALRLW